MNWRIRTIEFLDRLFVGFGIIFCIAMVFTFGYAMLSYIDIVFGIKKFLGIVLILTFAWIVGDFAIDVKKWED